jgi:hypothetical protein
VRGDERHAKKKSEHQEMSMKTLFATALVALSLLSTAVTAQAASVYKSYPTWAQDAFEPGPNY